jgi:arsenate reductase
MSAPSTVLFVCVHNAGRSQMAAALLAHHGGDKVRVLSAGSEPAAHLNPAVVTAMAEIGIDLTDEHPKKLTTDAIEISDVVITMGCGDTCPVFPGTQYLDWNVTDPAGLDVEQVRTIRDDIDARVQELLADLTPPAPSRTQRRVRDRRHNPLQASVKRPIRSDGWAVGDLNPEPAD